MPLPNKYAKVNPRWLAVGAKHEMEHTRDRGMARKIAGDHLIEHPSYYQVLPMAEQAMNIVENRKPPVKRKRREPVSNMPAGFYGYGR